MKLGILGYGKMGKIIEQLAQFRGHEIVSIIDFEFEGKINPKAECYIDFTDSLALVKNLPVLCSDKIPIVIGTTGWNKYIDEYRNLFELSGNKGIWSSNFSLGVNLFWQILSKSQSIMNSFTTEYDVMLHEWHHKNKTDSPSGTALQTAEIIIQNSSVKKNMITDCLNRKPEEHELHVTSIRGGAIPGTHTVLYDSLFDSIELTHTARSREGFAMGAILAAEKINGLPNGLHNFSDIFATLF